MTIMTIIVIMSVIKITSLATTAHFEDTCINEEAGVQLFCKILGTDRYFAAKKVFWICVHYVIISIVICNLSIYIIT